MMQASPFAAARSAYAKESSGVRRADRSLPRAGRECDELRDRVLHDLPIAGAAHHDTDLGRVVASSHEYIPVGRARIGSTAHLLKRDFTIDCARRRRTRG
jgi:hypothetical protein